MAETGLASVYHTHTHTHTHTSQRAISDHLSNTASYQSCLHVSSRAVPQLRLAAGWWWFIGFQCGDLPSWNLTNLFKRSNS